MVLSSNNFIRLKRNLLLLVALAQMYLIWAISLLEKSTVLWYSCSMLSKRHMAYSTSLLIQALIAYNLVWKTIFDNSWLVMKRICFRGLGIFNLLYMFMQFASTLWWNYKTDLMKQESQKKFCALDMAWIHEIANSLHTKLRMLFWSFFT